MDIRSPDSQCAASGHGVSSVDGKIDDDLFKLAMVDFGKPKLTTMHDVELNVLADQPLNQMPQFIEDVGDVKNSRLQSLLARKSEQLAYEIGRAVCILLDLHYVCEGRVARG